MQKVVFKLFRFDFHRRFCTDREKRPLDRSFVEQILNLFSWAHRLSKWCLTFPFTGARVYVKLDQARRIHIPCAELRYPDDVRLDSSDRHFIAKSDLTTVKDTKVTQVQNEELDLCRLIVKAALGFGSSCLFPPI